ncbi:ABATE domain-containing protein [Streptomyces sp. GMR22]|uniref:ABATE domain-containing protein n=1 Tax=Streptomyces sp. GMR22 TaxID=2759524 RepID=UPI0015FA4280|nr:ABATE domain-containing protein [Streptomyces sp. GMR22]MBA6433634.1 ABATE domain-containing protein [Streptomyces sp. GMR22]
MLPPTRAEDVEGLPADIALLHHFANTEDRRGFVAHGRRLTGHDALATPGDLERWLREHDLLVGDAPDNCAATARRRRRIAAAGRPESCPTTGASATGDIPRARPRHPRRPRQTDMGGL